MVQCQSTRSLYAAVVMDSTTSRNNTEIYDRKCDEKEKRTFVVAGSQSLLSAPLVAWHWRRTLHYAITRRDRERDKKDEREREKSNVCSCWRVSKYYPTFFDVW